MIIERRAADLLLLSDLPRSAAECARAIELLDLDGVVDVVPAFDAVGVYCLKPLDPKVLADLEFDAIAFQPKSHRIPICYELGSDLNSSSSFLGITPLELIALHSEKAYPCQAIGFCPGFAYLGPLGEKLAGVPRLASPRTTTPAGSLGVTGRQTAVYPLERPGGWPIIGLTPLTLVDVDADYFPISVGDTVTFFSIDQSRYKELKGERL